MRRLLLILLMVVLPVQWAWASAASVCAHETQGAHFGHHDHAHQKAAADAADPADRADVEAGNGSLAEHPDCGACHGMTTVAARASSSVPALWIGSAALSPYASAVPDRFVDTLLRPPSPFVS
ncbi:cobalt-zinc-cadmium resistance protein [Variovorax sp. J22P168]|uniref:cobalt-zinc-cadmium resistance protein n=1 Tax=Variovorax jilinensis TaxID=3053513 RepID=UPI002575EC62|nr:cobalt-zinc-cadmium resistance protein [Variovorax sp. J22P168]MDM0015028.1 cobalt-zinc-cadmium resistance protein [Variovorax sp. J22P168]